MRAQALRVRGADQVLVVAPDAGDPPSTVALHDSELEVVRVLDSVGPAEHHVPADTALITLQGACPQTPRFSAETSRRDLCYIRIRVRLLLRAPLLGVERGHRLGIASLRRIEPEARHLLGTRGCHRRHGVVRFKARRGRGLATAAEKERSQCQGSECRTRHAGSETTVLVAGILARDC